MSESTPLISLAERKRALVLEAELHRRIVELERLRLHKRVEGARESLHAHRWWIVGATAITGLFVSRKPRSLFRWIPIGVTAWRVIRNLKTR
jgi:hypothetical protein